MNSVLLWLKDLPLEMYIIFGLLLIIFILFIVTIVKIVSINRRLGEQDFELLEAIVKDEEEVLLYDLTVSNKAFTTNYLNILGFKKGNVIQVLSESNTSIAPRTKHVTSIPMEQIEGLTIKGVNKFKKIRLFAENELGLRQESKGKLINKYLKRTFKENKRKERKNAKEERFETGNYNFGERLWLIVKLFFRPFYKLSQRTKTSTNMALKESEVRRIHKAEHDKIEKKLTLTTAKANELKIKEESYKENKTREAMLELLKQEKIYEIEQQKHAAYEEAFEEKRAEILAINPMEVFEEYLRENPINYDQIEADILKELLREAELREKHRKMIENEEKQKEKEAAEEAKKAKAKEALVKEEPKEKPEVEEKLQEEEIIEEKEVKEEKKKEEAKKEKAEVKPKTDEEKDDDQPKKQSPQKQTTTQKKNPPKKQGGNKK